MSGTVGAKDGTVVASAAVGEDKIIENNCARADNSVGVRVPKLCSSFVYLMASTGEPDNATHAHTNTQTAKSNFNHRKTRISDPSRELKYSNSKILRGSCNRHIMANLEIYSMCNR
jgi:hypothetical protein